MDTEVSGGVEIVVVVVVVVVVVTATEGAGVVAGTVWDVAGDVVLTPGVGGGEMTLTFTGAAFPPGSASSRARARPSAAAPAPAAVNLRRRRTRWVPRRTASSCRRKA